MAIMNDIGCLQIDPIRAVERTQYLVLWSRLGSYDMADLDSLVYSERRLFEYWAHAASIVMAEDFPIFWRHMRDWASGDRPWSRRANAWMDENEALRDHVMTELENEGPLPSRNFKDISESDWLSSGWTNGQNVRLMLNYLWEQGQILVSRREGINRWWDLRERCLAGWTPREDLEWPDAVYRSAQKSLRALGVATASQIERHFTRKNYPDLDVALDRLLGEGRIEHVQIKDGGETWQGDWYIHADRLSMLQEIEAGDWEPRTTLLSPFDNLICDRDRTAQLFGFDFRIEIYVPKAKRQYGYYVLPILYGDRLIGRIDPKMDRKKNRLAVNAVYAEPDAPRDMQTGRAVAGAVEELAAFLGARTIDYVENLPAGWRKAFH